MSIPSVLAALAQRRPVAELPGSICCLQGLLDLLRIAPAGLGQADGLAYPCEKLGAELTLQGTHLAADGALGDFEIRRGLGEAAAACRGGKGLQHAHARQETFLLAHIYYFKSYNQ